MSPPPAPSSTSSETTSKMDPRLYEWMYGTPQSPGAQVVKNSSLLASVMQGVQNNDPKALAAFYNVPDGTSGEMFKNFDVINPGQPNAALNPVVGSPGSMTPQEYRKQSPKTTSTTSNTLVKPLRTVTAAEGGELGMARGGRPKKPKKPVPARPMQELQNRYSLAESMVPRTMFFDPETLQTTNPYYLKALEMLNKQQSWTDPGVAQQYMDPYMKNVVALQQEQANRNFAQQQNKLRSDQVGMGAFGGSRGALMETEGQRNQNFLLNKIAQEGMSNAYGQGMGQFNTGTEQLFKGAEMQAAAGNTLEGKGKEFAGNRMTAAQNVWGGVPATAAPATSNLMGAPWGKQSNTAQTGVASSFKQGGKLKVRV